MAKAVNNPLTKSSIIKIINEKMPLNNIIKFYFIRFNDKVVKYNDVCEYSKDKVIEIINKFTYYDFPPKYVYIEFNDGILVKGDPHYWM